MTARNGSQLTEPGAVATALNKPGRSRLSLTSEAHDLIEPTQRQLVASVLALSDEAY
ncbi:MAG: hypothetical protein ABJB97_05440 [Acidobacteriota bacterium]